MKRMLSGQPLLLAGAAAAGLCAAPATAAPSTDATNSRAIRILSVSPWRRAATPRLRLADRRIVWRIAEPRPALPGDASGAQSLQRAASGGSPGGEQAGRQ